MHRDNLFHIQQTAGERSFLRAQGVKIADRQGRQVGLVQLCDELHVGKNRGVACQVNRALMGQMKHVTRGLASIKNLLAILNAATVDRVPEKCDLNHGSVLWLRRCHREKFLHKTMNKPTTR